MSSVIINDYELLEEIKSLENDKKEELVDFIHFLKSKKTNTKKVGWEDITGVLEFNDDSSINHDKYIR